MQHLGRFWPEQAADKKENDKPTTEEASPAKKLDRHRRLLEGHDRHASKAVSQRAAHGLEEHSRPTSDTHKSRFKEHFLDDDRLASRPPLMSSPHILTTDPVLSRVHASTPHVIESDTGNVPAAAKTAHDIKTDSMATSTPAPPAHILEIDTLASTQPKGLWPSILRHDIQADEAAVQPSVTAHGLLEDAVGDTTRESIPHSLDNDKVNAATRAASTHHALEGDSADARRTKVLADKDAGVDKKD
jgi:hypothetical protein